MSEMIYALLLRLYPADFRALYAEAAMELFRDRSRDETGVLGRLRLWLDLVQDLADSLPRTYSRAEPALARSGTVILQQRPAFQVIQSSGPRGSSVMYAAMASVLMFGSLFVWVGHGRNHRVLMMLQYHAEPGKHVHASAFAHPAESLATTVNTSVPPELPAVAQNGGLRGWQPGEPKVENATKAMIEAISTHQIVMFGETHANKQEYEWLCELVKTPAFAERVDDIVVEFGNSLYQKSVDGYIAGKNVPFQQVQRAWRNVIGAVGPVSPVYGWFYEAVRESNLQHRGQHKIRLLLGDPYGNWDKINNAEDLGPYVGHRDQWYAQVVKNEVLAHHHHALLIMGAGHFLRRGGPGEVEQVIRAGGEQPYLVVLGTNAVGGYDDLDRRFDSWPVPAIVTLSGNWVGDLPAMPVVTGGTVVANSLKMAAVADAMLYVGPRDSLTNVNVPRSELMGTAYGDEVTRRLLIQTGQEMPFTQESETPQFHKPLQQTTSDGIHRAPPRPPKSINDPLPPRPPSQ
jgi:hypothetical protein